MKNAYEYVYKIPREIMTSILDVIYESKAQGKRIYLIGNGGSASTASHFAIDLLKKGVRAHALNENSAIMSAISNDENFTKCFSSQLKVYATPDDVLICFSVSGSSPDIIHAIDMAIVKGMRIIAFSGKNGGKFNEFTGITHVNIPSESYGTTEDAHLILCHLLADALQDPSDQ